MSSTVHNGDFTNGKSASPAKAPSCAQWPRVIARALIRGYQFLLGPWLGGNCRFYPSCSNYALEAVEHHGAARGAWLALKRICKCHPFHPGGVDPVPVPPQTRGQPDGNG